MNKKIRYRHSYKKSLILGTSIVALSIFTLPLNTYAHDGGQGIGASHGNTFNLPTSYYTCQTSNENGTATGTTASDPSLCNGFPYPSKTCTVTTGSSSSGGNNNDGGGNNGGGDLGFDVNNDGIGDYASFSEANAAVSAAGTGSVSSVGNCGSCGNPSDPGSSSSSSSSGGFFGGLFGGLFGGSSSSGGGSGGSGGGVGCFVTTATVDAMGEADNGPTLSKLRDLRDNYTINHTRGHERIALYYDIAPQIVETINTKLNSHEIWTSIYHKWIEPITHLIDQKKYKEADTLYSQMVFDLSFEYLSTEMNNTQKQELFGHIFRIHLVS